MPRLSPLACNNNYKLTGQVKGNSPLIRLPPLPDHCGKER